MATGRVPSQSRRATGQPHLCKIEGMKPKTRYSPGTDAAAERTHRIQEAAEAVATVLADLPDADNASGAVDHMLRANGIPRNLPWPPPFHSTTHRLHVGDARDMSWLA